MPDSPSLPDARVGSVIQERYKILAVVASGGMGVVYRGERLQLGRPVAIKFLHPWVAAQRSFLQRFDVEARAMSRLSHPNCASVIDFGVEDVPFLVMDFVAGRSLRWLIENERLEPSRALGLARQILSGVAHAHAQGIIHRDLKPENIIVSDTPGLFDHVRILDFGLAKLRDGPALTMGMTVGTPSYMAPEQTQAEGAIDARTDVYSVGVLLFEMLTGSKPFHSDNVAELLLMHQSQPAPRLSVAAKENSFSDALEAVVAKALAKASSDRFAGADEMAAALEKVPEAAARRLGALAPGLAPTVLAPGAGAAEEVEDTLVDLPRTRRPIWQRCWQPCVSLWHRRQRWVGATLAGAAVAILVVWVLSRGRASTDVLPVPPPAPSPIVVPTPLATDELAPMTSDDTPGLTDAAQLVRSGQREAAIASLLEIRRQYPRSAYADFLLAVVYFEKLWWSDGLQHAQAAIQAEPAYRRSPKLAKLVIYSLMSDRFWPKAATFLEQEMAETATPFLQEAAESDKSPRVRARAAQLLTRAAWSGGVKSGG